MFAKLTGTIDTISADSLILDVGGVGYHVFASGRTLGVIGSVGAKASLLIHTQVREDHIHLFGFASASEQEWFKLLTSVQGVGAKSALSILSVAAPEKLSMAIAAQDSVILRQADGVGPKLAQRIVTELKDKAQGLRLGSTVTVSSAKTKKTSAKELAQDVGASLDQEQDLAMDQDAVSALINLGYARSDAYAAVMQARKNISMAGNDNSLESIIRLALKELVLS